MATYGAKSPLFSPFSGSEPASADPVYGTGVVLGKLVSCSITPNFAEGSLNADNILAEYVKEQTDSDIALETDDLILANSALLLGASISGNDLVYSQTDMPPLGGFGFYHTARRSGTTVHIGHFFPKVRASRNARTFNTKGSNITFGTTSIGMKAMFTNSGKIEVESEAFPTEEAAYAWVADKLGVGTYHCVNVTAQGTGTGKSTDITGKMFLPAGEDFVLHITGYTSVTKAYDNAVDVTATITGGTGTYTVEKIDADHEIAIIF